MRVEAVAVGARNRLRGGAVFEPQKGGAEAESGREAASDVRALNGTHGRLPGRQWQRARNKRGPSVPGSLPHVAGHARADFLGSGAGVFLAFAWSAASPNVARADGRREARQSALREDFTVQTGSSPAAARRELVEHRLCGVRSWRVPRAEGDELAFVGGGRVFRTQLATGDRAPPLSVARTPRARERQVVAHPPHHHRANDRARRRDTPSTRRPRHMDLVETGRYDITLQAASARPTSHAAPPHRPAARLPSLPRRRPRSRSPRPRSPRPALPCPSPPGGPQSWRSAPPKLLRPGESFRLRGVVLDAKGCERTRGSVEGGYRQAPRAA